MMPIIETIAAKKEEVQQQQSIDLQIMCEKKEIESVISSSYLFLFLILSYSYILAHTFYMLERIAYTLLFCLGAFRIPWHTPRTHLRTYCIPVLHFHFPL